MRYRLRRKYKTKARAVKAFLLFTIGYLLVAILIASFFLQGGLPIFTAFARATAGLLIAGVFFLVGIVAGVVALLMLVERKTLLRRVPVILFALMASIIFQSAFTMIKNSMPYISPFFADQFFANLDKALHFGIDPWVITHKMANYLPTDTIIYLYLSVWGLPALTLPVIIAASDGNSARMGRTLVLYAVAWIVIGNIMAMAGYSAGPVFYDRLLGGARFADLTTALIDSGVSASLIGSVQQELWDIYAGQSAAFGFGISAFPSVHVAIATVTALYMVDRSIWLTPFAAAFLFVTFFMSVFTGYHYAVDGYVSILIIFPLWLWLKRRKVAE